MLRLQGRKQGSSSPVLGACVVGHRRSSAMLECSMSAPHAYDGKRKSSLAAPEPSVAVSKWSSAVREFCRTLADLSRA